MPIVFVHQGYSPYLEFTLRQARAADPDAEIVLLGDPSNDRFPFVRHVDATAPPYRAAAAEVRAVYRHLSTNRPAFELGCFERWFWLRTFLRESGTHPALVLDSDVLLFATEAEVLQTHVGGEGVAMGLPERQEPYRWVGAPHVSYWTAPHAEAFCDFALRSYTDPELFASYEDKWTYHVRRGVPGGVCDMTALYLYAQSLGPGAVADTLAVRGGATSDHNINVAENGRDGEFEMEGGHKAISWDGGRPYGALAGSGERVRFYGLHLQGHAKARIPELYGGPAFPDAGRVGRRMRAHYRARSVASRLLRPARRLVHRVRGG